MRGDAESSSSSSITSHVHHKDNQDIAYDMYIYIYNIYMYIYIYIYIYNIYVHTYWIYTCMYVLFLDCLLTACPCHGRPMAHGTRPVAVWAGPGSGEQAPVPGLRVPCVAHGLDLPRIMGIGNQQAVCNRYNGRVCIWYAYIYIYTHNVCACVFVYTQILIYL